ncbi:MAG: hypothetical protein JW913_20595 [Chitinispirillaceae bacterium]|nr:hypothetical protein [Chitinispirillaceae bacterium]
MISKITPDKIIHSASSDTSWVEKTIPFLGGRPERESTICPDDIVNLVIACNTCSTLEEFYQLT